MNDKTENEETQQEKKEREENEELMLWLKEQQEKEATKNLQQYLDLCKLMDDKETTRQLNDIMGNKETNTFDKLHEAENLLGQTLETQLTKQQGLLDKLSTDHSDLKRLKEEQLKRLKEEQNLDEDKKSKKKEYEYFIIIPNKFQNEQLQPYSPKNITYFYCNNKDRTTDKWLDPNGYNNIARLNWFNDKGFYLFNNDPVIQDVHTDQIKQKDIENGYKYVITDFELSYMAAKSLDYIEKYFSYTQKTQTTHDVPSLSIVLPYESRLVDLYETFARGYEENMFVHDERLLNLGYEKNVMELINWSNKLTEEQVKQQIEEQKQKIDNNPIQNYQDLIELIKTFDEAGLYQLLKATHKTMQKIQKEYGKEFASHLVFFELFLRKTKFYQQFFTNTLNVLKEKINQKKQEEDKKIQNNEDTNNEINITNHPENIQLKNDNSSKNVRISADTDRKLPIIPQKARTKPINIHKENHTSFKNQQKKQDDDIAFYY